MRKILLTILGLILLTILAYLCFESKSANIREDLISKTQSALGANEFGWAKVDLEGSDLEMTNIIKLNGNAPTNDAKIEAEKIALAVLGVGGVNNQLTVTNKLDISEEELKEEKEIPIEPVKTIKEDEKKEVSNKVDKEEIYKMYILKNAQGKILLDGYVENKDEHDKLINHAYKLFGKENVVNNLVEKSNAPKDWIYINEFSLDKLKDVDYGDMNITNTSYVFNAHLPSNDKKLDFLNSIREVMSNPENHYGRYRGDYIVTAPIAGAKPIKNLDEKIRSKDKIVKNKITKSPCQIALDDAISSRKIHFDYDKDNIKQESYIILDDVVRALKNCDLESLDMLEIAGHTDSIGSSIYNKRLSQKRANNIKAYLVNHGFNSNKIKAAGYGESKPIASNMTKDGRAKNRRIEFIVKGVR